MVKFSTWQIAFCLFSLCVFRGSPDNSKNSNYLNPNQINYITPIINELHSKIKNTMNWRASRQSKDTNRIVDRLEEYLKQVEEIKKIMASSNYSPKTRPSVKKGTLESMRDSLYNVGKSLSDSAASNFKNFIRSNKGFINHKLEELFKKIDDIKNVYVDRSKTDSLREAYIGDDYFKSGINSMEKIIKQILRNKSNWDKTMEEMENPQIEA